jgi:phage tail sheath gpL-like
MSSDAVGMERISRIVGYKITKGIFNESSPNLPQRIAILAEANHANQGTLDLTPRQITTAQKAGEYYGFGSPIYNIMRILHPLHSEGVGGIPVFVYPQVAAVGATSKTQTITAAGTATGNATHTVKIGGRSGLDGKFYDIAIEEGDSTAEISAKIEDAINNVLGCPAEATSTDYEATIVTKWKGLTAEGLVITVDDNDNPVGITYTVATTIAGTGTPDIQDALDLFGNNWNTFVINSYGVVESIMAALEAFNGIPDPENPTGRFIGTTMKPFVAITGSTADDISATTDAREDEVTIAIAPAPGSDGLPMEAAANMTRLAARVAQDNPHLDVCGQAYPDMPSPEDGDIGSMAVYNNRDSFVGKGLSTVDMIAGKYVVQDLVTTYHPEGEEPPQFRYVRNLMLDFNVRFGYYVLEQSFVVDHAIANDDDIVSVQNVIKPKQWKLILNKYADDLAARALISDPDFMQESIDVDISTVNPDRLETFFKYKRTGYARIASTTAEAGFNFGTLN